MQYARRLLLPAIWFFILFPFDRVFSLHIVFIGWVMMFLFPLRHWVQLVILLIASLIHDISYLYPLGTSSLILLVMWLFLSQKKLNKPWVITVMMFITAQVFGFLDFQFLQFGTMTVVQAIAAIGIGYILWKRKIYDR